MKKKSNKQLVEILDIADPIPDYEFQEKCLWGIARIGKVEYCFTLSYEDVFYFMSSDYDIEEIREGIAIVSYEVKNTFTGEIKRIKRNINIESYVRTFAPEEMEDIISNAFNDEDYNKYFIEREKILAEEKKKIQSLIGIKKATKEVA